MQLTTVEARTLGQSLINAADKADEAKADKVDLISSLQTLDDQARASLQAAIDAAK